MSTGKIELSVGAVKYMDPNEMITEEEYNYIKNKIPELDGRVGNIEGEIEGINSSLDNKTNYTVFVESFKRLSTENDDTGRIQRAIDYAYSFVSSKQVETGTIYISNSVTVLFDEKTYICGNINLKKRVDLKSLGNTIIQPPTMNKTIDFLNGEYVSERLVIEGFTFVKFNNVLKISTGDINHSRILIRNCNFHMNNVAIDTISGVDSRSTILKIELCDSYLNDMFLKNYCDKTEITNCFIYHSGYNGENILNDGNLVIDKCIFVPKKISGNNPYWISNYKTNNRQQGLFITNSRFGAEQGGFTVICNFADNVKSFNDTNRTLITISNCQLSSATTKGVIVLDKIPNRISIKDCFGFYDNTNGIITLTDTVIKDDIDVKYCEIELDNSVVQSKSYNLINDMLIPILKENLCNVKDRNNLILNKTVFELDKIVSTTKEIYKFSVPKGYSNGIFILKVYCATIGRSDNSYWEYIVKIGSGSGNNSSTIGTPTIIKKYTDNESYQPNIEFTIVDGSIVVKAIQTQDSYKLRYDIEGEIKLSYNGSKGVISFN